MKITKALAIGTLAASLAAASPALAITVQELAPSEIPSDGFVPCHFLAEQMLGFDVTNVEYYDGICIIGTTQAQVDALAETLNPEQIGKEYSFYYGDVTYIVYADYGRQHWVGPAIGGLIGGVGASIAANELTARSNVDHTRGVEAEVHRRVRMGLSTEDELRQARYDRQQAENACLSCFRTELKNDGRRADINTGGKIINRYELGPGL